MRQILLVLSVLLLALSWAVAQDTTPPSNPNSGQSGSDTNGMATGSGHARQSRAGGQMTVEGCLSGSNGSFTLSDKNGMTYQLTGDTAKLSEHVGHEVKVIGVSSSGGAGGDNASGAAAGTTGGQTLQVTSVKHVSKTCKSSGAMSH